MVVLILISLHLPFFRVVFELGMRNALMNMLAFLTLEIVCNVFEKCIYGSLMNYKGFRKLSCREYMDTCGINIPEEKKNEVFFFCTCHLTGVKLYK